MGGGGRGAAVSGGGGGGVGVGGEACDGGGKVAAGATEPATASDGSVIRLGEGARLGAAELTKPVCTSRR